MPTIKDIEERQKQLMAMFEELQREEDMTRYLQIVQRMEMAAKELEAMAIALESELAKRQKRVQGQIEVVLTHEQRSKVLRDTGVSMTTVLIDDPAGNLSASMPAARPADIEKEALRQATRIKLEREARDKARRDMEKQLAELEQQGPLMADTVSRLRQDPKVKAILEPPAPKK